MEQNKSNSTHEYFIRSNRNYCLGQDKHGMWHLYFQPINKKTGKPWQAPRTVRTGHNCHQFFNWNAKTQSPILDGGSVVFDELVKAGWTSATVGFKTREDAFAQLPAN